MTGMSLKKLLVCLFYLIKFAKCLRKDGVFDLYIEKGFTTFIDNRVARGDVFFYPINTTSKALNASFVVLVDISPKTKVEVKVFKFTNGAYRPSPIQISLTLKQILNYDLFDNKRAMNSFHPPLIWPIKLNVRYWVDDFVIDENAYPNSLPFGMYKLILKIFTSPGPNIQSCKVFEFELYLQIRNPSYAA